jgi:hypothetical protein
LEIEQIVERSPELSLAVYWLDSSCSSGFDGRSETQEGFIAHVDAASTPPKLLRSEFIAGGATAHNNIHAEFAQLTSDIQLYAVKHSWSGTGMHVLDGVNAFLFASRDKVLGPKLTLPEGSYHSCCACVNRTTRVSVFMAELDGAAPPEIIVTQETTGADLTGAGTCSEIQPTSTTSAFRLNPRALSFSTLHLGKSALQKALVGATQLLTY